MELMQGNLSQKTSFSIVKKEGKLIGLTLNQKEKDIALNKKELRNLITNLLLFLD